MKNARFIAPAAIAAASTAFLVSQQPAAADDVFSTLMAGGLTEASYWDVSLGGGILYTPKYEGSKKHKALPLPYVNVVWNDTIFLSPLDGLGVNLFSSNGFTVGTSAGYDFGREEKDSRSELRGMGKIKGAVTGTAFVEYDLGFVKADGSLTKHFGGSHGVTSEIGVKTFIPLAMLTGGAMPQQGAGGSDANEGPSGPALSLGVSAEWADSNYMQDFFGVNATQAARSGKNAYKAEAGIKSVSANIGLFVPVTQQVTVGSTFEYSRLVGDAAKSPLSNRDNQYTAGLFATYKF